MGWILMTACFNMFGLISKTISNQNEKSGIITMFSYIGIIYAMLIDLFVFDDTLNWIEWIGLGIIVVTVISLTIHVLLEKRQEQAA